MARPRSPSRTRSKRPAARVLDGGALDRLLRPEVAEALRRAELAATFSVSGDPSASIDAILDGAIATSVEREQTIRRLQQLAAVGHLGAATAHEVRNAMTGLLGFAQIAQRRLRGGTATEGVEELARQIEAEARRCLELLGVFLELPAQRDLEPLALAHLVQRVAEAAGPHLQLHRVRLTMDLRADATVAARDPELRQVLLNLLYNATEVLQPGGGAVKIATVRVGRWARVEVVDDGPGVAASDRERIFDAFYTTRPKSGGSGLGLYVSRAIARQLGGDLTVEEPQSSGARFVLALPIAEAR